MAPLEALRGSSCCHRSSPDLLTARTCRCRGPAPLSETWKCSKHVGVQQVEVAKKGTAQDGCTQRVKVCAQRTPTSTVSKLGGRLAVDFAARLPTGGSRQHKLSSSRVTLPEPQLLSLFGTHGELLVEGCEGLESEYAHSTFIGLDATNRQRTRRERMTVVSKAPRARGGGGLGGGEIK